MSKGSLSYALLLGIEPPPLPPATARVRPPEEDEAEEVERDDPTAPSMTERALRCIEAADLSTTALGKELGLSTKAVWGLLKSPRESGRVIFEKRRWKWNPGFVPDDVRRAAALLRRLGWTLTPPGNEDVQQELDDIEDYLAVVYGPRRGDVA